MCEQSPLWATLQCEDGIGEVDRTLYHAAQRKCVDLQISK